ncbi:MAG: bifunctional demethylmenaquinone methyltransferase/2-methoxy-6-polyprenyl-1,4-benzoquinol methylase UbiE [Alphaproteobacteria bacterium]|nr:bifunctional demethylmenaquinone methyltransferase/2-methoxy-6-polyprenyl-1,4-benzoquinol methylase UbiE [Alphaproteobacteria bacterium]
MTLNPESNWFGTEAVTPAEKTAKVRGVFDSVADRYDLMNDLMSGGVHRLWKDRLIREIRPRPGLRYLDVAGGTGDIAFRMKERLLETRPSGNNKEENSEILLCDLDEQMLRVGRDRAINKGWLNDFQWITGNAEALPVPDNSVDVVTISFGLRNVTRIDTALQEFYRVLKPGGRFFCLEFSRVEAPVLARLYDSYSYAVIPRMGALVTKDRASYQYLVESIRKMPPQRELVRRMGAAGFARARYMDLSFGIAAIHTGWKI